LRVVLSGGFTFILVLLCQYLFFSRRTTSYL
jgi:hypothetical protein